MGIMHERGCKGSGRPRILLTFFGTPEPSILSFLDQKPVRLPERAAVSATGECLLRTDPEHYFAAGWRNSR